MTVSLYNNVLLSMITQMGSITQAALFVYVPEIKKLDHSVRYIKSRKYDNSISEVTVLSSNTHRKKKL